MYSDLTWRRIGVARQKLFFKKSFLFLNITTISIIDTSMVELNLVDDEYAEPIYQGISAANSNVVEDRCCSGPTNGTRKKIIISLICIALASALGIDLKWPQTRDSLVNGQPSIRYLVIFNHSCKLVYL